MLGDELRLKHSQTAGGEWSAVGCVMKIPDSMCENYSVIVIFSV